MVLLQMSVKQEKVVLLLLLPAVKPFMGKIKVYQYEYPYIQNIITIGETNKNIFMVRRQTVCHMTTE